jgi:dipeptidyl aminopeptidase/acylaminoacyl peptidase
MRARLLTTLLIASAIAHAQPKPAATAKRESGALVYDGVPELRADDRARPYFNTRGAALADWDPAGGGMLITTRFGNTNQLHHVAGPATAREQLTFFDEPVAGGRYDARRPDGFWFSMDSGGGELYQLYWFDRSSGQYSLISDGKSRNEGLLAARAGGRLAYSSTRRDGVDFDLYIQPADGPARLVKEVKGQWNAVDWSPDDQQLLVHHEVSISESFLFTVDAQSGEAREINPSDGKKKIGYGAAVFSGDGRSVFYSADEDSEVRRLTRYELAGGKKQVLTPKLAWDVDGIAVSRDGAWIAYTANEGGESALYLAKTASPLAAARVAIPRGVVSGLRFDRASKRLGFTLSTATTPSDVFSVDVATRKPTRWTFSELGGLNPAKLVTPSLVKLESFDGREVPAWLYEPRSATGKLPVIVLIHGGPEAQAVNSFQPTIQYWVNELHVAVVAPNVRGSFGYGKSWLALDDGVKREDSVKDIGALLDWIAKRPELDGERVAVFGGSYGGYMVLASLVHYGERLRCGAEIVGISNFVTFLEHTQGYRRDLRRVEYGDERDPAVRAVLTAISPTTNAAKIKRPLFVGQGANDPRVPASEAEQIVATVRKNGGPVWYLLGRDEGHGFQKKGNRDALNTAVSAFFGEYLLK